MTTFDGLNEAWSQANAWIRMDLLVPATLAQGVCAIMLLAVVLLIARPLRRVLTDRADRLSPGPVYPVARALAQVAPWILLLLLVWFAILAFDAARLPVPLLRLVESLAIAWVVIRLSSNLVRNPRVAQAIAAAAWVLAALNIAGLVAPIVDLLGAMALPIGNFRLSVLLVLKGIVTLAVLIWLANVLSRVGGPAAPRLSRHAPGDAGARRQTDTRHTACPGCRAGARLDRNRSDRLRGVLRGDRRRRRLRLAEGGVQPGQWGDLLLDRSIKPGDVIEIEGTYGWITNLNARYVSVSTRDGKEHLIPNEDLITQRVVNWSYSNNLVRQHAQIGVSYKCDPHEAIRLALQAAGDVPRVLKDPKPVCLLTEFGDSSVNLELRFWINDPSNGTANVKEPGAAERVGFVSGAWD